MPGEKDVAKAERTLNGGQQVDQKTAGRWVMRRSMPARGRGRCRESRYKKPGAGPGFLSGRYSSSRDFRIRHGDTFFEKHNLVAYISRLGGVVKPISQRFVLAVHLTDFWRAIV